MKIEIAEHERMSESGSSLLRLIQNNDTCRLDLLVRESVQNCLDAGDKCHDSVIVNVDVKEFETRKIAGYFEQISGKLLSLYPGKQTYISIRDRNTVGLTGPVRYSDIDKGQFGNLLKLVYEISKPQEQYGAGGSWGLGKTVYFRIGMGLVLYYSRIKKEGLLGGFESRLAAALVEDETSPDHLLPKNKTLQRGIAWWGAEDRKESGGKHTVVVTNEKEIRNILADFGISPYGEKETGTTIIIPFIKGEELLEETIPSNVEQDTEYSVPTWCKKGITDYLKIAFQRWYAPRLNNEHYRGQYLEVFINGEKLTTGKMAPVFQLIQALYNTVPGEESFFEGKRIFSKAIELRNTFAKGDSKAGMINYAKVTAAEMKMEAPDNYINPYYYINKLSSETMYNDPIVMYTRKPGMIVSYSTTGDWTEGIPKAEIGEFIIGLFKVNSDNNLSIADMNLEEYIRRCEKADHMAWDDWSLKGKNPQIIARIKKGVRKKIKDDFTTITASSEEKKNMGLGKMLADVLLPPNGFTYWDEANGGTAGQGGTGGSGGGSPSGGGGGNNTSHAVLKQNGPVVFTDEGIEMPVRIMLGKKKKVTVEMHVDSEKGAMTSADWENTIETPFPIQIRSFTVQRITHGKGKKPIIVLQESYRIDAKDFMDVRGFQIGFKSSEHGSVDKMLMGTEEPDNYVVDGILSYSMENVQGSIALKEDN